MMEYVTAFHFGKKHKSNDKMARFVKYNESDLFDFCQKKKKFGITDHHLVRNLSVI